MGFNRCGVSNRMGWRIVSGPEVGYWTASKMNGSFSSENSTAIGLERNGELVAGIMYENWNGRSIMAHIAITGQINRSYIGAIFRYAYVTCGVEKAIVPVSSANAKSMKFVEKLGFTEEARIADAAPDGDIIVYTLKKADCRYLGERYG